MSDDECDPGDPTRRVVVGYFVLQAVAVLAWWGWLSFANDAVWAWFFPAELPRALAWAFVAPDVALMAGGSAATAWMVVRGSRTATAAAWLTVGASGYATLWCLAAWITSGDGVVGAALMTCSAGLTLALATVIGLDARPSAFRPSLDATLPALLVRNVLQIAVFWGVFLLILPAAIVWLESQLGVPRWSTTIGRWLGFIGFALASSLGLWSGWSMARVGQGTPLPTDCASRLVTVGPYRFLRNPMATAGITQGVFVGVMWGSAVVVIYAVFGGLVWHLLVRPTEESDLVERFGEPYEQYRREVRCWWPRLSRR